MKTKPPQFSPPLLAYERKHVKIVKFLCCAPTLWYPVPLHYRGVPYAVPTRQKGVHVRILHKAWTILYAKGLVSMNQLFGSTES